MERSYKIFSGLPEAQRGFERFCELISGFVRIGNDPRKARAYIEEKLAETQEIFTETINIFEKESFPKPKEFDQVVVFYMKKVDEIQKLLKVPPIETSWFQMIDSLAITYSKVRELRHILNNELNAKQLKEHE